MRFTATGDLCGNACGVKWFAVLVVIVSAIALNDGGLGQWSTALAADGWDRVDQRQQLGDLMAIGAGQNRRQWNALGVGQEVVL